MRLPRSMYRRRAGRYSRRTSPRECPEPSRTDEPARANRSPLVVGNPILCAVDDMFALELCKSYRLGRPPETVIAYREFPPVTCRNLRLGTDNDRGGKEAAFVTDILDQSEVDALLAAVDTGQVQ